MYNWQDGVWVGAKLKERPRSADLRLNFVTHLIRHHQHDEYREGEVLGGR